MTAKVNLIMANNATGYIITKNGLSGSNLSQIASPYGKPTGLAFDRNTGQLISGYAGGTTISGKVIVHVGVTAEIASEFVIPSVNGDPTKITRPYGIAFDGTNIIVSVYDQDPAPYANYHIVVLSGKTATVVDRIVTPSIQADGMSWDGENLIYADHYENKIYVLEGKTGVVKYSFDSPSWGAFEECWGVAWDGITLAVIDKGQDVWVRCKYPTGIYINGYTSSTYVLGCCVDGLIVVPTVLSVVASSISTGRATLNGNITDKGGETLNLLREFEYYKDGDPSNVITVSATAGGVGAYSKLVTGLLSNTKYFFRAKTYLYTVPAYGEWLEFTTLPINSVTTQAATEKAYKCAMGNGTIVTGTGITERGFEVELSFSGTLNNYINHSIAGFIGDVTWDIVNKWHGTLVKTESETGSFGAGAFELVLGYPSVLGNPSYVFSDKLFECESYTYRAYMVAGGVTYYGDYVAFTTLCYPKGHLEDDQLPIEDIIPPLPPIEFPPIEFPPFEWPEFEWPEFEWPEFDYPDIPPYNGSWLGAFYYRKAFGKKDLDELRKKCRIFLDNSVEYALVLNHNMQVLKQFLNDMHDYMTDIDEYNTFKPIIPTQWVNELAHKPLDIKDFKVIINNFISNSIDNASNVNHNFRLIRDGLSDVMSGEDIGMEINSIELRTKTVEDDSPDVERLKKVVDALSSELEGNYETINHNLHVIRATLI